MAAGAHLIFPPQDAITTRKNFLELPLDDLKSHISQLSIENLQEIFSCFDESWVREQEVPTLTNLINRAWCVIRDDEESIQFGCRIVEIVHLSRKIDYKTSDTLAIQNLAMVFKHNPAIFKRRILQMYNTMLTNTPAVKDLTPEQEHLATLEVVLSCRLTKIANIYLENPPVDSLSPHGYDLLTIVCLDGTFEDFKTAIEVYEKAKGKKALQEYVKNRGWDIGKLMMKFRSLEQAKELVEFYRSKGLDPATFICRCRSSHSTLDFCTMPEQVDYLLQQVNNEQLKAIIEIDEGLIKIYDKCTPEGFDQLLTRCEEAGISLSKICTSRNSEGLSVVDHACLHRKNRHLPILLKRINDEDERILLSTHNYGFRTPLGHALYYGGMNSPCAQIIESEMQRLGL